MKKIYILAFLSICFWEVQSQDIHFTYFEFSPLTINPAMTGGFEGTYRISGIYRDQYASVSLGGRYATPNLTVDLPVIRGFRKQDWIGLGITLYQDNSSQYNLKMFKSSQSFAYHLALDKKQNSILSIGVQQGTARRSLDLGDRLLNTETKILSGDPTFFDPDHALLITDAVKINDWAVGMMYRTYINKTNYFRAGLTVGRIYRENQSIASGSTDIQRMKVVVFGEYDTPLTNRLYLNPQVLYQRTSNNQELSIQGELSYWLSAEKDFFLNAGLGYRIGDAVQFLVGADYKDWKFGISYDINANRFRAATNTVGGFEIAVTYIGKVVKKPKVDPTVVCPRL